MRIVAYICACLALGVATAAGPSTVHAQKAAAGGQGVDAQLETLEEHILYARYGDARGPLEKLAADNSVTAKQRVRALELLAILQIAVGDDAASRATLKELCTRDPDHKVDDPDVSPKVVEAFQKACKAVVSHVSVQMENIVPTRELLRQQPVVKVRVSKFLDAVDSIHVFYRKGAQTDFVKTVVTPDAKGMAQALITPEATEGEYDIFFYVEAIAPSGGRIGRMGSVETPLRVTVPAAKACTDPKDPACRCEFFPKSPGCPYCFEHTDEKECSLDPCVRDPGGRECRCATDPNAEECRADEGGSIFGSWWFWTIAGAVVVGGTVAGIVLLSPSDDPASGSLGSASLK